MEETDTFQKKLVENETQNTMGVINDSGRSDQVPASFDSPNSSLPTAQPSAPTPVTPTTSPTPIAASMPRVKKRLPAARAVVIGLILLVAIIGGALIYRFINPSPSSVNSETAGNLASQFDPINIPLDELSQVGQIISSTRSLTINGQLKVSNTLTLAPGEQPANGVAGQIYYDQNTNQLNYFNGNGFVELATNPQTVTSIGGASGTLTLAGGLSLSGNTLSSQAGILSVTSASTNLSVTNDGAGNITINDASGQTGVGIQGQSGVAGRIAVFSDSDTITSSLLSQAGNLVTIDGDVIMGETLTLQSDSLSTINLTDTISGVTGMIYNDGNMHVTGGQNNLWLEAGGSGTIFLNAANGNPVAINQATPAAYPLEVNGDINISAGSSYRINGVVICDSNGCLGGGGGGGVDSLNGLTGALSLNNATAAGTTVTIDDASTSAKGLSQFNATNFSVVSGVVNTIQAINTTASPTFASINTNSITPSGPLTVGATAQDLTLQGANTTITRSASGNTTTLSFVAPTANVTYRLQTAAAGTYDVCTTAGNCVGIGGGVTTAGGTTNTLAKFTNTNAIGDSIISDNGAVVTVSGDLGVTGALTLSTPLTVAQGGTGANSAASARTSLGAAASGANSDITSLTGLTTALSVIQGGTGATALTANGVLLGNGTSPISSIAAVSAGQCLVSTSGAPVWQTCPGSGGVVSVNGLTGTLTITNASAAGSTITLNDASTSQKGIAQFNATNFSVSGGIVNTIQDINTTATPTFAGINTNSITPSTALTVGATTQNLTLQGASTTITSTASGNTATLSFVAPTANVTYRLQTAAAGTYDVCTTAGNCVGIGGGVTTAGGTTNTLAKFTGSNAIGDSIISDDGAVVTVSGDLSVTGALTLSAPLAIAQGGTGALNAASARANLGAAASGANSDITSLSGLTTALSVVQGGTGATSLTANGVLLGNGTAAISSLSAVSAGQCLVSTSGAPVWQTCPGSGGVVSVNSLTGTLTIANASAAGSTITLNDASTSQKGIAQFNSTNFSVSGGIVNTIQDINTTASPTFAGINTNAITPSGALTVGATTQNLTLQGASTTISSTASGNTTTLSFVAPTTNVTYRLQTAAAGTYDVCTTAGNCTGLGGSVTTTGGTTNQLAKFTGSSAIGDSSISDDGSIITISGDLSVTGAVTLAVPLAVTQGGTGAVNAAGGRANLGAAASGANSDITSLSGLTTALSVVQGGTGATSLTANGVLLGNGTAAISSLAAVSAGECLVSTSGAPVWQACPGSGGVASVNGLTGALTIANASAAGSTITLNDASTAQKGIAQFNSTNFTVTSGVANTIQDIAVSSAPTFGRLTVTSSQASSAMLLINNTNASGTGNLIDLQLNGSSRFAVSPAGALTLSSTINGQTISSSASFTGTLGVAGAANLNGGATVTGTLTANTITPTAALTVGATNQSFVMQGNASSTVTATSGANTTTLAFQTPTASVTYRLLTAAAGTYDICTTVGNCAGVGGGVTTAGGTTNQIAKFTGTGSIGDSIISDNGTTVTIGGTLAVNTITPAAAMTIGATSQNLTLQGAVTNLTATNGGITNTLTFATPGTTNKTITLPNASGTVAVSASGPLSIDGNGNISCASCLTSGGGGGGAVDSLNGLNGTLTIANASGVGSTITIDNASTSAKGIAQFNSTNFSVASGVVNTIQDIATSSAPTFGRLTVTSSQASNAMMLINNTNVSASGNLLDVQLNGSSRMSVTPAGAMTLTGALNGQTISSAANFTGTLAVASLASLNGGATVSGTLTANTITPTSSMTVGATSQSFLLQGTSGSTITATSGANTTTVAFQAPTAAVTYRFLTAAAGTYDICTTVGNCAGVGGGVTTAGGTTNQLAKFTGSNAIGDSIISDNGTTVAIGGTLAVNTLTPTAALTIGATAQNLTMQGAVVNLSSTSGGITNTLTFATPGSTNKTITVPNASGTLVVSASGPLAIDAAGNITCATCAISGSGVTSLNSLTGALTIANASATGSTVTIDNASTSAKGIAQFNSTNFSAASGVINTIQNINTAATPQFGRLTLSSSQASAAMLTVNNTNVSGSGNLIDLQLNGSSRLALSPAGNMTLTGTLNGQTISSAANFTGSLAVATTGTFGGDVAVNGGDITSSGALNITPGGALTAGVTSQSFLLQGSATSTVTATNGASTTTLAFQTPTANATYRLLTAAAGTYDICTSAGNCSSGIGGSGTTGRIAKFTASGTIGDSILSESGTTVTVAGTLAANTALQTPLLDTATAVALNIGTTNATSINLNENTVIASGKTLTMTGDLQGSTATFAAANALTLGTSSSATGSINFKGASGTNSITIIGQANPTSNQTITLPDATGTVCLQSSTSCGFAASTGSTAYIQNGTTLQTNASMAVQSASDAAVAILARARATQSADIFRVEDSSANYQFAIDNFGNASAAKKLTVEEQVGVGIAASSSEQLRIKTASNTTYGLTVTGSSVQTANLIDVASRNVATSVFTVGGTGAASLQNTADSTAALAVNNAAGRNVVRIDTSGSALIVGNITSTGGAGVAGTIRLADGTNNNLAASLQLAGTLSGAVTFQLPNTLTGTQTICVSGNNCNYAAATGSTAYIQNGTTLQSANFYVQAATSGTIAAVVQGHSSGSGGILSLKNSAGTDVATFSSIGAALFQNSLDSINALSVKNAANTTTVFNVDTSNGRVGVGGASGFSKFEVQGGDAAIYNSGGNPRLILGDSGTFGQNGALQWDSASDYMRIETVGSNGLKINDNNVSIGNIYPGEPLTVGSGSTQLFQVQAAGGVSVTNKLTVGSFGGAGLTDCDASNSKLLWDTTTSTFSCGTDRASFTARKATNEVVNNSATLQDDDTYTFSIGANETWAFQIYTDVSSTAAADFRAAVTAPSGATCRADYNNLYEVQNYVTTTCGATTGPVPHGDAAVQQYIIYGTVVNGSTPGSVTLQWAQGTATAVDTTMYAGGHMVAYKLSGADLAEAYYTSDKTVGPGDVVQVDGAIKAGVKKTTGAYSQSALGIVSTEPGYVLGSPDDAKGGKAVLLALSGRVPVKVSTENGAIKAGDYLTASSTPGVAMKATRPGQMIGTALEDFSASSGSGTGLVSVFVNPIWATPDASGLQVARQDSELQGQTAGTFTQAVTMTDKLTVKDTLTVDPAKHRVVVGTEGGDAYGTTLVLGNKTTAGDPEGTNGAMYYSAVASKFRCYEDGTWKDCITDTMPWSVTLFSSDKGLAECTLTAAVRTLGDCASAGANSRFITKTDLTNAASTRVVASGYDAFAGGSIKLQYSHDGQTWKYLDGTSGPSQATDASPNTSEWTGIQADAKGDVWIRAVASGSGTLTSLTNVTAQFK